MCALNLLCVPLARMVLVRIEVTCVGAPVIGVIALDAKRLEQPFALQKYLILPPAKDIRQDLARVVIDRMPPPALRVLRPHRGRVCPWPGRAGQVSPADSDAASDPESASAAS